MIQRIWLIAATTFIETIRQPVYCLIIFIAGYLIGFSPCFTMFTMLEGVKLVRDMGLGSMMLAGLALGVFSASSVITQELEKRTVLTLMSKPVGRFEWIVGKYLGIAAGLAAAMYILSIVLQFTTRMGVPEAAYTKLDYYPLWAELAAFFGAVFIGIAANYFFDKSFTATAVVYGLATFTLCFVAVSFVSKSGELQAFSKGVDFQLAKACALVTMAVLVLAAAAVAVATRGNFAAALVVCVVLFMLGLVSDYLFGRPAVEEASQAVTTAARVKVWLAHAAYAALPNLQVFWMSDAVNDKKTIPLAYLARAAAYAGLYASGLICVALCLFQEREMS